MASSSGNAGGVTGCLPVGPSSKHGAAGLQEESGESVNTEREKEMGQASPSDPRSLPTLPGLTRLTSAEDRAVRETAFFSGRLHPSPEPGRSPTRVPRHGRRRSRFGSPSSRVSFPGRGQLVRSPAKGPSSERKRRIWRARARAGVVQDVLVFSPSSRLGRSERQAGGAEGPQMGASYSWRNSLSGWGSWSLFVEMSR